MIQMKEDRDVPGAVDKQRYLVRYRYRRVGINGINVEISRHWSARWKCWVCECRQVGIDSKAWRVDDDMLSPTKARKLMISEEFL